jgi:hypothetical protein
LSARSSTFPRDQAATPFAKILDLLCVDSGAQCAALVDAEGETVDYGGRGDPFEIRVLAAELRLVQQHMQLSPHLAACHQLVVRAQRRSFLVEALAEGYALVVELPRRSSEISQRALASALRAIALEAGFPLPPLDGPLWRSIEVREEGRGSCRPAALTLDGAAESLVVLGRLAGDTVARRERGFRVRLGSGREGNLVREALGHWFLEEED